MSLLSSPTSSWSLPSNRFATSTTAPSSSSSSSSSASTSSYLSSNGFSGSSGGGALGSSRIASASGSPVLRSRPPRCGLSTPASYFSGTTSVDLQTTRRRMLLGREDALDRSGPVRLTSYRELSESRLPLHQLPPTSTSTYPSSSSSSSSPSPSAWSSRQEQQRLQRRERADSLTRGIRRLSVSDLSPSVNGVSNNYGAASSPSSSSSSSASTISASLLAPLSSLDVNGNNCTTTTTATTTSSGLLKKGHERSLSGCSAISGEALAPSPASSDSGLGSRSITPSSACHYRALGSSNSSVDSIDVPVRALDRHRLRRVSSASADSSSGISIGSRSSARSLGSGSTSDVNGNLPCGPGLVRGLRNLGNSCFMNSIIQCLVHTQLADYFRDKVYRADINNNSPMRGDLAQAFASLVTAIWNSREGPALSPTEFRSQIQKYAPRFMGYAQQDAQEFLRYLLQGLHEDVNRVRVQPRGTCLSEIDSNLSDKAKAAESWRRYLRIDDSRIVDLFVGQLKSTLQCGVCGHKSVTFDPFWDLSLPISDSRCSTQTLQQCLELFTKDEVLEGDEKPTCEKCKKRQRMTKKLSIWKCPKILVLHLKRFGNSERYRSKLETEVHFPLRNLDISNFLSNEGDPRRSKFNLIAVSNHSGSTHSGHYTASCLNPHNKRWYCCNDARVSEMSDSSVVSPEAYVLFYELDGSTFSRL